ncbi:site-specific DNA-methyltransferase [Metamycoplasma hominis]|uniref:site-specific DNA-methyltransferase n=2 Tax=Metamycoplasma hominis TaxID=2098 RepID=UPI0019394902|nr:site-specific DNA-methyltransferase [Metamycoplasma hominis]
MIYIDPPYNTDSAKDDGNNLSEKDDVAASKFIYRDKFSRTGWLNMMNERLKMARQLLKEDGVIFVSIDDNEQAYLKVLMDEIFGEENFVSCLHWLRNPGGQSDNKYIAKTYDFILMYAKNKMKFQINTLKEIQEISNFVFDKKNNIYWKKNYVLEKSGNADTLEERPNMGYVVYYNPDINDVKIGFDYDKSLINKSLNEEIEIYQFNNELINKNYFPIIPRKLKGTYGRWRMGDKKFLDYWNNNQIMIEKTKSGWKIYEKLLIKIDNPYTQKLPKDWIDFASNQSATILLKTVLPKKNKEIDLLKPKPIELINFLINLHPNSNARILDFFAGSGTTGHAVLDLNKEDGGNRTFTLVTNNENNIGIDVCYERLYRINNGKGSKGETDFDWIKKNEPYNQNLDVFKIKYYDTDVLTDNNEIIKQDFKNMLNDFDLSNVNKINEQEILLNLTALKPVEGKDSNESN